MSVQQGEVRLVQAKPMGAPAPIGRQMAAIGVTVGQVALGILDLLFRSDNGREQMEKWARTERVSWYPGCRR